MAYINLDVDYFLDEASIEALEAELKRRKKHKYSEDMVFEFKTPKQQFDIVRQVLGIREFHSKERVLRELKELSEMI